MVNRIPKSQFPVPNSQSPLVSIIITTKNEEKNIENCLESILNSRFPIPSSQFPVSNSQSSIEIIVVDNNSTDKTVEIVKSYCHCEAKPKQSHIRFYTKGPERSAQRNFGVKKVNG
ncbi:MAG: glycosyltransferase [bacterium]|nr:glycosyltransferase [bacterium]